MAVNLPMPKASDIFSVAGAKLGVAAAGIRYPDRDDVLLITFDQQAISSAVFTKNAFCAAPVHVAKEHLHKTSPRALIINAGNANAVTGEQGLLAAYQSCELVAKACSIDKEQVLPFSTGVIGEQLPMDAVKKGIDLAAENLADDQWLAGAAAIMTTDTQPKVCSLKTEIQGETVTITGIAKGSGMICPDMATMLAYIVTDAVIEQSVLDQLTQKVANNSFNAITVDGDTSTNDSFVITATQQASNQKITHTDSALAFKDALEQVAIKLAQAIIRDGEGATKFVEVKAFGGVTDQDCKEVALTVANSPLVKTALFASDPNWGRLLMAIGRTKVDTIDASKVSVVVNGLRIVYLGEPDQAYTEEQGQAVFEQQELSIEIELGDSEHSSTIWTTDLSHEYVTINAEYRS